MAWARLRQRDSRVWLMLWNFHSARSSTFVVAVMDNLEGSRSSISQHSNRWFAYIGCMVIGRAWLWLKFGYIPILGRVARLLKSWMLQVTLLSSTIYKLKLIHDQKRNTDLLTQWWNGTFVFVPTYYSVLVFHLWYLNTLPTRMTGNVLFIDLSWVCLLALSYLAVHRRLAVV